MRNELVAEKRAALYHRYDWLWMAGAARRGPIWIEVTVKDVRDDLDWIAVNAPQLRHLQIDDGYQPWMGDWLETGKSFGGDITRRTGVAFRTPVRIALRQSRVVSGDCE